MNNNINNNKISNNYDIKKNKNMEKKNSYENKITQIQKYTSIEIANSLINLMNFDKKVNNKYNKIINKIYSHPNNFSISNPPRKEENNINNEENKDKNINIIYYDENIDFNKNISNIFDDSRLFERVISNDIFLLAIEERRFKLILNEIY